MVDGIQRLPVLFRSVLTVVALATLLPACATRSTPSTANPAAAAAAIERTAPERPLRAIFSWQVQERDARFDGSGAARIEPPYRARLDLFGPRGDAYLSAAVVDSEIRLPPGVRAPVQLPSPSMMWAVLGVVRPPDQAVLAGTREDGSDLELHYTVAEDRLVYLLGNGRLRRATWKGSGRRMSVELEGARGALPGRAVYRDWSGHTELVIRMDEVDEVDTYPPEIWRPGG